MDTGKTFICPKEATKRENVIGGIVLVLFFFNRKDENPNTHLLGVCDLGNCNYSSNLGGTGAFCVHTVQEIVQYIYI